MKTEEMIKILVDKIESHIEKIIENRQLQKKVWENKKTYLPIITSKTIPDLKELPDFNFKESFYDAEKMLYMQLKGIVSFISDYSDAVPSVRFNFGTGFIPSLLGLKSEIFEDKMPWLKTHLSKEEIKKLKIEDFENPEKKGLMGKVMYYLETYRKFLPDEIKIYLPDTQGPFDIAHLIRGNEIFTDIYDDPEFFEFLLEFSTFIYIKVTEKLKQLIGESFTSSFHSGLFYIEKGGIRICEDTTILLSPKHIKIILHYTQKCLKHFGGGWIHYCGQPNHFFDAVVELPELSGININCVYPEKFDEKYMFKRLKEKNKVFIGTIPRKQDENWKDYLKRVYELSEGKNLIFVPSLRRNEKVEDVYQFWNELNTKI